MMLSSTYLLNQKCDASLHRLSCGIIHSANVDASYGVVFKCVKIFSKLPERNSMPLQIEDVAAQFAESGDESE
jgi:hypothetical protein